MEKEQLDLLRQTFKEAYDWRADKSDIDWKPTRYKDKATGLWKEGQKLAYLSWAVAWRKMKEFYPDANYRLIETLEGSPLWNINGYGILKCAISACGVEYVETFPIMQGGQNEAMKIEEIDGRDINDSAQRGLTKAIARFGVGLYIFEGKLEAPKTATTASKAVSSPSKANSSPTPTNSPTQPTNALSVAQKDYLDKYLEHFKLTREEFKAKYGFDPYQDATFAKKACTVLKQTENLKDPNEKF